MYRSLAIATLALAFTLSAPAHAQDSAVTEPKFDFDERAAVDACVAPADRNRPASAFTAEQKRTVIGCVNAHVARTMQKQLPQKVDSLTTLVSISATGPVLRYDYRVDVDAADMSAAIKAQLSEEVRKSVCASDDMRSTIAMDGVYDYSWLDRGGKPLHQLRVDRCDPGQ